MDIFDVLSMVGGLALFLYGMQVVSWKRFSNALPPISGLLCCLAQV